MSDPEDAQVPSPEATPTAKRTRLRVALIVALAIGALGAISIVAAVAGGDDRDVNTHKTDAGFADTDASASLAEGAAVGDAGKPGSTVSTTPAQRAAAERRADTRRKAAQQKAGTSAKDPGAGTGTTQPGAPASTSPRQRNASTIPSGSKAPPPTAPLTIEQAYIAAYRGQCAEIWKIAGPDGLLWDVDDETVSFRVTDCESFLDPSEAEWYEFVEDAQQAGAEDAIMNLTFEMSGYELRNTAGTRFWSE